MSLTTQNKLTLSQLIDTLGDLSNLESDPELQLVELQEGEVLFEQGQEADGMYVLVAGVLGVRVRHKDSTETVIDRLAPGAIVGEMKCKNDLTIPANYYKPFDKNVPDPLKRFFRFLQQYLQ